MLISDGQKNYVILEQMIIHLKAELSMYRRKVQAYQNSYPYHQLETLKIENNFLKEKISELKREKAIDNEKHKNKIAELNKEVRFISTKQNGNISTINSLKKQHQDAINVIMELENHQKCLIEKIADKDKLLLQTQMENEKLSIQNKKLQELLNEKEITHIEQNNNIEELRNKIKNNKTNIKQIEEELVYQIEENRILNEQTTRMKDKEQMYQEQVQNLDNEINISTKRLEGTESILNSVQDENEKLHLENKQINEEIKSLKLLQKEMVLKIISLKHEIESYPKDQKCTNGFNINQIQNEIKGLSQHFKELSSQILDFDETLLDCLQQIDKLENQIDTLTEIIDKLINSSAESLDKLNPDLIKGEFKLFTH